MEHVNEMYECVSFLRHFFFPPQQTENFFPEIITKWFIMYI